MATAVPTLSVIPQLSKALARIASGKSTGTPNDTSFVAIVTGNLFWGFVG